MLAKNKLPNLTCVMELNLVTLPPNITKNASSFRENGQKNGAEIGEAWTLVDTQYGLPTAEVGRLSHSVPGRGTTRARQIYH